MDRELLFTVAVVTVLLLAGCASTPERSEPLDGLESGENPQDSGTSKISQLDIFARGENLDDDPQKELGVIIYGKDAQGRDAQFSGSLDVELEREVSTTYELVHAATVEVSEDDFIRGENLLGDIRTGFARHFDDEHVRDGEDYRLTARLIQDDRTYEATEKVLFFTDEAENQAPPDDGEYVTRASVDSRPENVDNDAPSEVVITVKGTDDQENSLAFGGSLSYAVLRNAGDSTNERWVKESEGRHDFEPGDFEKGSLSTTYKFVLDDDDVIDGEDYKLEVNLTVDRTSETYGMVHELFFYDNAEDQSEPSRSYSDHGGEVTRISVYARTDNRDADAAEEGIVEVEGRDSDDATRRFSGTLDILLEREAGDYQNTYYEHVRDWTVEVGPNDFSGAYAAAYTFLIDDGDLQTSESYTTYRVTVTATMNATGETFSDRDEIFYSGG